MSDPTPRLVVRGACGTHYLVAPAAPGDHAYTGVRATLRGQNYVARIEAPRAIRIAGSVVLGEVVS